MNPQRPFRAGDKIQLEAPIAKANPDVRIHPSSHTMFPACLAAGALGEVLSIDHEGMFVKFMLRPPGRYEQEYLKDNVVHFTLRRPGWWALKYR